MLYATKYEKYEKYLYFYLLNEKNIRNYRMEDTHTHTHTKKTKKIYKPLGVFRLCLQ